MSIPPTVRSLISGMALNDLGTSELHALTYRESLTLAQGCGLTFDEYNSALQWLADHNLYHVRSNQETDANA
jgi:hypothetical protein